jgi:hypothetical protein
MDATTRSLPEACEVLDKVPGLAERAGEWMEGNSAEIRESVAVYSFLRKNFEQGSVTENPVFQFVFRSFYRMDNAGLTRNFHARYFELMEQSRASEPNLRSIIKDLRPIPNRKNQLSLQFSFLTKLAHTVSPERHPIYDSEIAVALEMSPPYNKEYTKRLDRTLEFYERLQAIYREIADRQTLSEHIRAFRECYSAPVDEIPETKVIDFIFWSAGKQIKDSKTKN